MILWILGKNSGFSWTYSASRWTAGGWAQPARSTGWAKNPLQGKFQGRSSQRTWSGGTRDFKIPDLEFQVNSWKSMIFMDFGQVSRIFHGFPSQPLSGWQSGGNQPGQRAGPKPVTLPTFLAGPRNGPGWSWPGISKFLGRKSMIFMDFGQNFMIFMDFLASRWAAGGRRHPARSTGWSKRPLQGKLQGRSSQRTWDGRTRDYKIPGRKSRKILKIHDFYGFWAKIHDFPEFSKNSQPAGERLATGPSQPSQRAGPVRPLQCKFQTRSSQRTWTGGTRDFKIPDQKNPWFLWILGKKFVIFRNFLKNPQPAGERLAVGRHQIDERTRPKPLCFVSFMAGPRNGPGWKWPEISKSPGSKPTKILKTTNFTDFGQNFVIF